MQHSGTIEPVSPRRGRDCLVELLLDFWALDLNKLPLDQLHGWFNTVALCIIHLLRADAQYPDRPFRAAEWLEIVVGRVAEEFPRFPGGVEKIRQYLRTLMARQWEPS